MAIQKATLKESQRLALRKFNRRQVIRDKDINMAQVMVDNSTNELMDAAQAKPHIV